MAEADLEKIDSQVIVENVSFLDSCFDNSFNLQSSLLFVKEYANEELTPHLHLQKPKKISGKLSTTIENNCLDTSVQCVAISQIVEKREVASKSLKDWGLPHEIANKYEQRGISEMFDWQVDCLSNKKVLLDSCNLVYSAPTSAGKTLVAEILTIKTILQRQKKVIIILPFVSIVREKMFYLQDILSSSGVRVEGFMGSQSPPGGLQAVHVAICTIEKANSLVNHLLDDGNISELGAVIVDELHLLGDPHRGYILELLLTKIKYVSSKLDGTLIQIVGMSATLPNLDVLAGWLSAELYVTQFRPIPLDEFCLVGNKCFDKHGNLVNTMKNGADGDNVLQLCLDTIKEGCSILIFCMTKNRCENLAQNIASSFYKFGCSGNEIGLMLRQQLKTDNIVEVLEQLKNCPVGLDQILKSIISFGVAYHHAGLTFDERDIIEAGFKSGALRVLVATSTLSSGVNLPARKVVIRCPVFQRKPINILTYKQMIGRAGRMGKDTKGESILICTEAEKKMGFDLMMGALDPVKSCIESEDKYMRAVLEMIASQVVSTKEELDLYSRCTLLFSQQDSTDSQNFLLQNTLDELINFELVRVQCDGDKTQYVATHLGKACLSSSMAPNDGLSLFCELQKARQCLVLETDLHLIYLVTPYSVSSQWGEIDWLHLLTLWESLTIAMKRVGELVGVQESFIIRCLTGTNKLNNVQDKLNIHKRFYTALALQDLVNEVPLSEVANKFQCARGFLQSLQQAAATFAGMVTAFSRQLGWKNMETLISQFQDRLHFGIHSELLEIMKLPSLNGVRARALFDAGFETIASLASANLNMVENALHKAVPFQSEKEREGDESDDIRKRNKIKNVWITGFCGMTTKEASENLIMEARKVLEAEIGVSGIKWENKNTTNCSIVLDERNLNKKTNDKSECSRNESTIVIKNEKLTQESNKQILSTIISNAAKNQCPTIQNSMNDEMFINEVGSEKSDYFTPKTDLSIRRNGIVSHNNSILKPTVSSTEDNLNQDKCDNSEIKCAVEEVRVEINEDEFSPILNHLQDIKNSPFSRTKDEVVWDTLNFTEAGIENISKVVKSRSSDTTMFSPNIALEEDDNALEIGTKASTSKSITIKDISLFSSEGDNSSLFEESQPLDFIPSKIDDQIIENHTSKVIKSETVSDFVNLNSNSILNAFKSTLIDIDDDMKLVYDEDNSISDNEHEIDISLIDKTNMKSYSNQYISPFKRPAENNKEGNLPSTKKIRMTKSESDFTLITPKLSCKGSKKTMIQIFDQVCNCFVLKEKDIVVYFDFLYNVQTAAIYLDIDKSTMPVSDIGCNLLNKSKAKEANTISRSVKSITLYFDNNCLVLDLTTLKDLSILKLKIESWFHNSPMLRMVSLMPNFVQMKRLFDIDLPEQCKDVSLDEWLLDSDSENISHIVYLYKKYCDIDLTTTHIKVGDTVKMFKNLDKLEESCVKSWALWMISQKQEKVLRQQYNYIMNIIQNVIDTETQVLKILAKSEYHGVTVDKKVAAQLLTDVKDSQEVLQKKAYQICGYHFNFNSSKDVAKVLGIYKGRKVSTKKSVLTSHNSPIATIIIYWRKLNSILTKTLYPLTEQACIYSEGDIINPSYTMHTCTGRISMREPNLQNVPRTFTVPAKYFSTDSSDDVIEFNCRNIFKASAGYVLVSADYCQLEMRILTHYSEDKVLTSIMRSDADVFKSIASSWSGIPENEVDDDLRQKAKQLCYGILYGMGNKTLSIHLDVTEIEAAVFMDSFYKTYPLIKQFTRGVIEKCRVWGYVETLMKRRRYLKDITSDDLAKRGAAERQAVNTTIQGSASDIAKAAMCAIDKQTKSDLHPPRLLLQMHDELIYEVPEASKRRFVKIIKEVMEDTVRIKVPLPVKVKSGSTWGSLKEIKS